MSDSDKLPLLQQGLRMLVNDLDERDRISMVAYAGASGLVLPSTSGADKQKIRDAIDRLEAGGSTNGGAGIALAYAQARKHFVQDGVNRVLLASDGEVNVGVTDHDELIALIEQQRKSGVFLSVLGFGRGNLNDATMEQLADKGNGNYAYIDSAREARKVLVQQAAATLVTIAKDVKLQVEFNPSAVSAYRLIGYENRRLAAQDFKDDRKDAGELGSGHTVTGLYEVVPVGVPTPGGAVDPLKFQRPVATTPSGELFTIKLRYKRPASDQSSQIELGTIQSSATLAAASSAFRLAAAVAAFAERLKAPESKDGLDFAAIYKLAASVDLPDPHGYRKEFLELVRRAESLARPTTKLADEELG
jgi:Ca-activated chloride channel family protein